MSRPYIYMGKLIPNSVGLDKYENGRPLFKLEHDFTVHIDHVPLTVPAGFEYDHASIPRGLWNLYPPYDPKYAAAACVHDWLYAARVFPRAYCDAVFRAIMAYRRVRFTQRWVMWAAVRLFGWLPYTKAPVAKVNYTRHLRWRSFGHVVGSVWLFDAIDDPYYAIVDNMQRKREEVNG